MASLWNKLTFSNKANLPSNPAEPCSKSTRKQSISARSRKTLSLILPNVYGDPSEDKENAPGDPELGCEEAGKYPIYDPGNPDHNTACQSPKPPRASRSWSPLKPSLKEWAGKESLRSKSPSPSRMITSSRKALNDFANTVKAKAASVRPSTPPELLRDPSPMGRDSEKSLKSKKSVHWRSSDTTATSPKAIPKEFSPLLPDIGGLDQHFLGSAVALTNPLTARPPPTPILAALENLDEKPQSIELQRPVLPEIVPSLLPTPMPGTNLPLEDPFEDNAAVPEQDFKIFEDLDHASEDICAALKPATDIELLVDITPSTLTTPDCLEHCIPSRASSHTYDADHDSTASEDSDGHVYTLTRVHPRPPYMLTHGNRSTEMESLDQIVQEQKRTFPEIGVSIPVEDNTPKGHLGILQATTEVESTIGLDSPLDDSDKEKQRSEEGGLPSKSYPGTLSAHIDCGHGCRVPSLSESIEHGVSPSNSPSQRPLVVQLTAAKRLRSSHLQANVISSSLQRDAAAFRFKDSSDDNLVIRVVDETEYSGQADNDTRDINNDRSKTPSPASLPLPETPTPTAV